MPNRPASQPKLQVPDWPLADDAVRQALLNVYASGDWGRYHGRECHALAAEIAEYLGVPHVMLCASGTVAVELALRGLGVGPGDEVLLAGYDFPGNFRAIEAVGATAVLVDLAEGNWNLDPAATVKAAGPAVRAMVVSHLHGGLVPMRELSAWARRHGVGIVEDACQCPGAMVETRPAGCWGDVGVWSFGGSKLLTAGRGGAVFTSQPQVFQRMKIACERGNHAFPLSELQAAVLRPQLARLDAANLQRSAAVEHLMRRLTAGEWVPPDGRLAVPGLRWLTNAPGDLWPAYYKLGLKLVPEELRGVSRAEFLAAVRAEGVPLDEGFRGFVHRAAAGERGTGAERAAGGERACVRCRKAGELHHARLAAERMLVLHHPVLLADQATLDGVAQSLASVARRFAG